jgi:hypothetical protein
MTVATGVATASTAGVVGAAGGAGWPGAVSADVIGCGGAELSQRLLPPETVHLEAAPCGVYDGAGRASSAVEFVVSSVEGVLGGGATSGGATSATVGIRGGVPIESS